MPMCRTRQSRAFTLVELMVGLMVTSIILSAVATLAFAMSSACTAGGDSAFTQAQIRHATLRLSELIANCKLICAAPDNDLVLWRADNNDDGKINVLDELVYIEQDPTTRTLRLCEFLAPSTDKRTLAQLRSPLTKQQLRNLYDLKCTPLISDCSNVQFRFLDDAVPPRTRLPAITFEFVEDGVVRRYETVTAVRCRADYLLDTSTPPEIVASDDD
jgi:prepilin-type N-terminal cleavage/methylation domain-containing protein